MKTVENYYKEISHILATENASLSVEFDELVANKATKQEIFFWLQKRSDEKELSEKLDELVTDFFYSIR